MDWPSKHEVILDCRVKMFTLKSINRLITVIGDWRNCLDRVVFAALAEKMIMQVCEGYFIHVIDTSKPLLEGQHISTMQDFLTVFLENCWIFHLLEKFNLVCSWFRKKCQFYGTFLDGVN